MARGILGSLAARLAQPFIELGVRLGRTVAQIGRAINRGGIALEASAVRRQVDAVRQVERQSREVLGVAPNRILDPLNIPEAITRQRRQFAWQMRTRFINPVTGRQEERMLTISTDSLLSAEMAIAEAEQLMDSDYAIGADAIITTEVVRVTKAGSAGTL